LDIKAARNLHGNRTRITSAPRSGADRRRHDPGNSRQADAGLIAIRLGLAISRSLSEAASGELALMDGEALGFVVRLPVDAGQA